MSIDTVCSTHVAEDDVTAQFPSDRNPSPATSCDIESCILTDTFYSSYVCEVGLCGCNLLTNPIICWRSVADHDNNVAVKGNLGLE